MSGDGGRRGSKSSSCTVYLQALEEESLLEVLSSMTLAPSLGRTGLTRQKTRILPGNTMGHGVV